MTEEFLRGIPASASLEGRFAFIDNATLRSNVTIYLRYIIFLSALSEDKKIDSLQYTLYKNIIIFTASIVESVLEYAVNKYIVDGKASKDVFGWATKYAEAGKVKHDCDDLYMTELWIVRRTKRPKSETGDEISFNDINKAARNCGILDDALFAKADKLREKRNLIHLQSLDKSSDDYFTKGDVEDAFKGTKLILQKVETVLARA